MKPDEFADGLRERLERLQDVLERRQRRDLALQGITPSQSRVLAALLRAGSLTAGALAGEMGLAASTVTRIVDVLERERLVERRPSPGDRRVVELHLTPAGFRRAREIERWKAGAIDQVAAELDPERHELILDVLATLVEHLDGRRRRDRGTP